ncbi:MAG: TolC family protein [Myxococcales bacterium]
MRAARARVARGLAWTLGAGLWSWSCLAPDPGAAQQPLEPAPAQQASPLTLQEVLQALERTHPKLRAARFDTEGARARVWAATGAWNPRLEVEGKAQPWGYYENGQLDARVRQFTPLYGAELHAGYGLGAGDYPVYKRELETLSAGELRAGLKVPLWKGGPIDPRRAEIARTEQLSGAAACQLQATRLSLRRDAAEAYYDWVAAGQVVRIQRELLAVAEQRDAGIRRQVQLGSLPPIVAVDNGRLLLDREGKLVAARRKFQEATIKLSLYLRDAAGRPRTVGETRVPTEVIDPPQVRVGSEAHDIERAVRARPEVCGMAGVLSAARTDVELAENQRAPDISAQAGVSRDLGSGAPDLAPTEVYMGLSFEMPLGLTQARGKLAEARAKLQGQQAKLDWLRDQIGAEVRTAHAQLQASARQLEVARKQVVAARELADGERKRFQQGASDLLAVNLREIQAAEAARQEVEARADYQQAAARYRAALGQLP